MWDYDKLFAEGNVVGIKVLSSNKFYNYIVDNRNITNNNFWSYYKNDTLSDKDDSDFEIQYIIRLDEHGNVVERLFDREKDMLKPMPELETGMFVRVYAYGERKLGFVDAEQNHIIYQSGGYDFIDDDEEISMNGVSSKIVEVYEKEACGFDYCCEDVLIWRSPEYQHYLDSKN